MGHYPKQSYVKHLGCTVLQTGRGADKPVEHPREKPGNIILVHGVNDVGAGFSETEQGLCAGLEQRLYRRFKPAANTLPTDKNKVVDDPDAVYFKRKITSDTDSPVIPFYWGFREVGNRAKTVNGQKTDRYGNRLDKDLSKGGGPFGNATSTLPDMWNRGVGAPLDIIRDPLRPLRNGPGRMYMVLAARRLAALVSMIRDYETSDTVTIVAHSQGCLLSLLAQAFLMERGERCADTLILTHPPYSLDEESSLSVDLVNLFSGGTDAPMEGRYDGIAGSQSLHGRLQTLVNIVQGVAGSRGSAPAFARIGEAACGGMVEGRWQAGSDRDNRGKVYLYFSPEDMTVALENMKGIGWQGVPDYMQGTRTEQVQVRRKFGRGGDADFVTRMESRTATTTRMPLKELGDSFRQRVFTAKRRLDPATRKLAPVMVGLPPHDFALRIEGEDDHAHVESSGRGFRAALPVARWPLQPGGTPEQQRHGIRRITGEALRKPCMADMRGNQVDADRIPAGSSHARLDADDRGPCEDVDPITATIPLASEGSLRLSRVEVPDPAGKISRPGTPQSLPPHQVKQMEEAYNESRNLGNVTEENRFVFMQATRQPDGKVIAVVRESREAARRRWQNEFSAKSFHSAIFDSRENHRQVTAYDVAIGSGKACSDPKFYAYLCAVADWRLKKPNKEEAPRQGILTWAEFLTKFGMYFQCEPLWRRELIEGNVSYYSTGVLPACLPLLTGRLLDIVVSETTSGKRLAPPVASKEKA